MRAFQELRDKASLCHIEQQQQKLMRQSTHCE